MANVQKVAFIGLGVMGAPMAAHLVDAGFALRVWNRTAAKAEALVARGAQAAGSPAESAGGADAVITMVADDRALRQVTYGDEGVLQSLSAGAVHLSMSTVSPQATTELAEMHRQRGVDFLAVPVFGSKESAMAKKLWAIAAGPRPVFERTRPVIEAMTAGITWLDENPAAAAQAKIIVNMLISTTVASLVQAFTLGSRAGLARSALMEVINRVFNSPLYERYGDRLVARDLSVFFPLKLMLKDLGLALDLGAGAGVALPHAAATREMAVAAIGQGFGDEDAASGILRAWEKACGATAEAQPRRN